MKRQPRVRVVDRPVPACVGGVRLRRHQGRARHRLDAAGDEEVAVARDHRVAGTDHRGEAGGAEAVHRHARDRFRQAREERREPRDVPVVLARLVRAAEPDVLDLARRHAGTLDRRRDRDRREVVRADARKPAAVSPDRGPDGGEDDGASHDASVSSSTRCAIANALFAAGTPQ